MKHSDPAERIQLINECLRLILEGGEVPNSAVKPKPIGLQSMMRTNWVSDVKLSDNKNKTSSPTIGAYDTSPEAENVRQITAVQQADKELSTQLAGRQQTGNRMIDIGLNALSPDSRFQELLGGVAAAAATRSAPRVTKGVANLPQKMNKQQTLKYLEGVMGTKGHKDWTNSITSNNRSFELKDISLDSLNLELPNLDKTNIERYKKMDFSKSPPIVVGSTNQIIDGYHRANVARQLGHKSIRGYVGTKDKSDLVKDIDTGAGTYSLSGTNIANTSIGRSVIPWEKNYGRTFKITVTPPGAASLIKSGGEQQPGTVSVVTPANKDAWNWEEAPKSTLERFRKNWGEIQKTLGMHKYLQIKTGKNYTVDQFNDI